jgi:hypothetical protein
MNITRMASRTRLVAWRSVAIAYVCVLVGVIATLRLASAQAGQHRTFATPEDAAKALIAAAKSGSLDDLQAIFGPDSKELIDSADPATARMNRQVFTVAAGESGIWKATRIAKTLVIGNEDWPFPVPIAKTATNGISIRLQGRKK